MATNNAINNTLSSPFNVGGTSVTSTGTQLNYLSGLTSAPINIVNALSITSGSGTYTPTAGMKYIVAEIYAGGGGGGGATGAAAQTAAAAGGTSGQGFKIYMTAAQVGAGLSYSVGGGGTAGDGATAGTGGTGGNTTFGDWVAGGGGGGTGSATSTATKVSLSTGASASTIGTGTLLGRYNPEGGEPGFCITTTLAVSGKGGGVGGGEGGPSRAIATATTLAGSIGSFRGCGGSGAATLAAANESGGAGMDGAIFILEYISA